MYSKREYIENQKHFIKFLIVNHIYELFIRACNESYRRCDLHKMFLSPDSIGNAINSPLGWADTKEGWNFWANVSYKWKRHILDKKIVQPHNVHFFENTDREFLEIKNLFEYVICNNLL